MGMITGCKEHDDPGTVYVMPGETALTPTSSRPEPRVYATTPTAPPEGVAPEDLAVAASVRDLLKGAPNLSGPSEDVLVSVKHGVVTLRGNVPAEHDRDEIVERIARLPGVNGVDDKLGISLR